MDQVITTDPNILGGTPVFSGTRVPVVSLFDYLQHGESIGFFLEQFPSVERSQVERVLEHARATALSSAGVS